MRKQDFIRVQRTRRALQIIEKRFLKVWERTYTSECGFRKGEPSVYFEESTEDVLRDLTVIKDRVAWARSAVEELLSKAV